MTLLFTDLVDSVALRRELGDHAAASLLQAHRQSLRQTLARFPDADEIETAGDSFLLVFARPSDAVRFALLVQMQTRTMARDRQLGLAMRVGIHVGEVVVEEHTDGLKPRDLYGTQTDLCARVMGLAAGDQILMTRSVFDNARQTLKGAESEGMRELVWLQHGPYLFKGIEEPVEVCEVGETGLAALHPPSGSEKALRQTPPGNARATTGVRALVTSGRAMASAALVVAVATIGLLSRGGAARLGRRDLDRNIVVVAPFDVPSEALALWREGMMDVLARALDGVGPLRAVSPTVVVRSWKGHADRTGAEESGHANGAGLAVYGELIAIGPDSVRATVTAYDVRGDSALGRAIVIYGAVGRMDRVADAIGVRVFNQIGLVRQIGSAPTTALGSRSLPAIRAFLKGEQLYRRNEFAPAQAEYEEAIVADTTFALAYRRMRNVVRWFGNARAVNLLDYAHRAGALNHGLGLRDSLLILADSLLPDPNQQAFIDLDAMRQTRRRFAALEQAAAAYPNDPEVWTELGEARARVTRAAPDPVAALSAFERAIAADSLFGPAYPTAVVVMLHARGRDSALAVLRRYLRINPSDSVRSALAQILEGKRSDAEIQRITGTLSRGYAGFVAQVLAKWPDADETGVRLFRLLTAGPAPNVTLFGPALRFRGHLREAAAINDSMLLSPNGAAELLFLSRYVPTEAIALDSLSAHWLADRQRVAIPIALTRAADRRDTVTLARALATAEGGAAARTSEPETREWQYLAGLAHAYLSLARGDSAAATRAFAALPDSLAWQLTTLPAAMDAARLFARRGLVREALSLLDRHAQKVFSTSAWQPWWNLEMARVAGVAGDSTRARANYAAAAAAWIHADPGLLRELEDCAADLRRRGIK